MNDNLHSSSGVAPAAGADMRRRLNLGLKGANLLLGGLWSFALTFVLIRTLTLENYAVVVITGAVGAYVMAVDLGFTGILFSRARAAFLDGEVREAGPLAVTLFLIYLACDLAACATFWAVLEIAQIADPQLRGAFALLLFGFGLALPWSIVRAVMNATDRYIAFEIVELFRRALMVVLPFLMFLGLSFQTLTILTLLVWVAAYAVTLPRACAQLDLRFTRRFCNLPGLLRQHRSQLGWAASASITEFGVHNFPFLLVPILSADPRSLIAFDVFYKVTRFAALAYSAINEAYLPVISKALHNRDARETFRALGGLAGFSSIVAAAGALCVTVLGTPIFGLLLGNADLAPAYVRSCIAVFITVLALQCATRFVLLYSGQSLTLARLAFGLASGMALWAAGCLVLNARLDAFLIGYVAVYACAAFVYAFHLWGAVKARTGRPNLELAAGRS